MNGTSNPFVWETGNLPEMSVDSFQERISAALQDGADLLVLFGMPGGPDAVRLAAALGNPSTGTMEALLCRVEREYLSLAPIFPQVQLFEREIAEKWGIKPVGHPWLKPVRYEKPSRGERFPFAQSTVCGTADFFQIEGEEIHEVAVGPVHAGIIEPGHFRFQCHGETVFHLEIQLGYQHRGIERALVQGPTNRTLHLMETAAGDTTIGHATAYCQAVEAALGIEVPPRAQVLRGVALELERMANHIGDLGALAGDVGFLPTQSFCGRLRGDVLNLTARLCGNRFGRGLVRPGGVAFDAEPQRAATMASLLETIFRETEEAVELLWNSSTVMARFEGTGPVFSQTARRIGLVGPAARACGLKCDTRADYPHGVWKRHPVEVAVGEKGEVADRARVRWMEIRNSARWILERLSGLPEGPILAPDVPAGVPVLPPGRMAVSLTEGWRGRICHAFVTDDQGRFAVYKIVDPSFFDWSGLAWALRNQQISDFPLCNKSFNLSYCGFDL